MGSLFSTPKMPAIEPPTPLPDQKQLDEARRRLVLKQTAGSGTASTIYTAGSRETLGA